ncbi:hypothetical protein RJ640_004075 [Escallonia rubra]|uniref:Fungal lipase-type domain-containing protein n=1 Tax=Escallonia rubra TaxID=112253 RepID=A0AA88UJD6_9ASTE|nr:hypothetical protein RJ640_004075 [Escallonia rubra]
MQMFDDRYVHHGLLKSAIWLLNQKSDTLKRLWVENGSDYKMVFAGHSLGSGVAALLTDAGLERNRVYLSRKTQGMR